MLRLRVLLACTAMVSISAYAGTSVYGSWVVSTVKVGMYAATQNDSGEVFGEYCFYKTKNCDWLIGMHTGCTKGKEGVVLANSDAAATPLAIMCTGRVTESELYQSVFASWRLIQSAIRDSSKVGFAVPLQSDRFEVVRFSLVGRSQAQKAMEKIFKESLKDNVHSTKDQIL